jgi:hypothetical protein
MRSAKVYGNASDLNNRIVISIFKKSSCVYRYHKLKDVAVVATALAASRNIDNR